MLQYGGIQRRGLREAAEDGERLDAPHEHSAGAQPHRIAGRRDLDPLAGPELQRGGLVALIGPVRHQDAALPPREHRRGRLAAHAFLEGGFRGSPVPAQERGETDPHVRLGDPRQAAGRGDAEVLLPALREQLHVPGLHELSGDPAPVRREVCARVPDPVPDRDRLVGDPLRLLEPPLPRQAHRDETLGRRELPERVLLTQQVGRPGPDLHHVPEPGELPAHERLGGQRLPQNPGVTEALGHLQGVARHLLRGLGVPPAPEQQRAVRQQAHAVKVLAIPQRPQPAADRHQRVLEPSPPHEEIGDRVGDAADGLLVSQPLERVESLVPGVDRLLPPAHAGVREAEAVHQLRAGPFVERAGK